MWKGLIKGGIIGALVVTAANIIVYYSAVHGAFPLLLYYSYLSPMELLQVEETFSNFVGRGYSLESTYYIEMVLVDLVIGFLLGALAHLIMRAIRGMVGSVSGEQEG